MGNNGLSNKSNQQIAFKRIISSKSFEIKGLDGRTGYSVIDILDVTGNVYVKYTKIAKFVF